MLLHHHYVLSYQRARPILASTSGADQSDNHRTFLPIQRLETPIYKALLGSNFFFPTADSLFFGKVGLMVGFQPEAFYSVRFYTRSLSESDIELGHLLNLCQKLACSMENCRDILKSQQKNPGEIGSTHSSTSLPQMISKIANLVGLLVSMDHWDQDWSPASLMGRELETQEFLEGFIPARLEEIPGWSQVQLTGDILCWWDDWYI